MKKGEEKMAWSWRKKKIEKVEKNKAVEAPKTVEIIEAPWEGESLRVQGMLFEMEGKDAELEHAKVEREGRKEYYDAKAVAMKLEEKNNSKMYIFPSFGGAEGQWYKIGGKSALFYKYLAGPRMGRKEVKIRKDTDLRMRFKHGVVAVHWGERFIRAAEKAGYRTKTMEYGIIVVDLDKKFTVKEIKEMAEQEKKDKEKLQTMIMPKENMPDFYARIRELARILVPKVKTMHPAYRETFGMDLLDTTAELFRVYFRVANGTETKGDGKRMLLASLDNMTGMVALADEVELFDLITRTRFGEHLVDIRAAIERNFREKENGEGN